MGENDSRRIPIRQRSLHPSMLGCIDIVDTSVSDPGQSGSLSPFIRMDSMYFDDSLYENEMHYKIAKYLEECPLEEDEEEICIKCDNEKQYNDILDALFKFTEGKINVYGTTKDPMEIIIEPNPQDKYRKFDEGFLMKEESNDT